MTYYMHMIDRLAQSMELITYDLQPVHDWQARTKYGTYMIYSLYMIDRVAQSMELIICDLLPVHDWQARTKYGTY